MPCSACGGGGSSASSQFSLGRRGFKPLQARQPPKMIYVTPARAAALRAYYAQIAQAQGRRTLRFA
jgi:hypothetical protein|tara:strand:- start:219 stop:416 length:198 start_codon:yes stop_codon:yes gene_type:complete